jgi:serine/threonine-protein kinase
LWEAEIFRGGVFDDLPAGHRIGNYRIVELVGRGGMASVYLGARADGQFDQHVALKILDSIRPSDELFKRFEQERQILAKLEHPNIARLLDGGLTDTGRPYVAMEYTAGKRIDEYCDDNRLTIRDRVRLMSGVLDAVEYAHRNLIIHRDIKPSNILVTDEGVPKLLDFGIAKLLDPSAPHAVPDTRTAMRPMTPEYASPEQVRGERLTIAADVYQLGLLLYRLVTGCLPYRTSSGDYAALVHSICNVEPTRPGLVAFAKGSNDVGAETLAHRRSTSVGRLRRELDGDVGSIVMMAMRKEPEHRYATATALAADLGAYLDYRPISARARSRSYVLKRYVRRHRLGTAAAAVIAITVFAAALAVTSAWRQTLRQMAQTELQREAAVFESRRAELTNDFLNVLLTADGGGEEALGGLERLELGVEMIEAQYAEDSPAFAGRMLIELGDQFRGLTDVARAVGIHDRAYALGEAIGDFELMAMAQCAAVFAQATARNLDEAPARIEDAQRSLARIPEPDPLLQASCLRAEARLASYRDDDDRAILLLQAGLRLLEESDNEFRTAYTSILNEIGGIYNRTGRVVESLEMSERVLATHERYGRGKTASRLTILHNLSVAHFRLGEVLASNEIRERLAVEVAALEPEGAEPLWFPISHADVLNNLGRHEQALVVLGDAVERARSYGSYGVWLPEALLVRAAAQAALGRTESVEHSLSEASDLLRQAENLSRGAIADTYLQTARLALDLDEPARVQELIEQALSVIGYPDRLRSVGGHRVLTAAARIENDLGHHEQAETYASSALPLAESISRGPDTSAFVGQTLLALAYARHTRGAAPEDLRPLLERAVRCLTSGLGAEHRETLEARALLNQL